MGSLYIWYMALMEENAVRLQIQHRISLNISIHVWNGYVAKLTKLSPEVVIFSSTWPFFRLSYAIVDGGCMFWSQTALVHFTTLYMKVFSIKMLLCGGSYERIVTSTERLCFHCSWFVCLSSRLLATLRKNGWTNFHEIFRIGGTWYQEHSRTFSGSSI